MKTYLIILFVILIPFSFQYPQNTVSIHGGYGHYLSNSENSLPVMGDENFRSYFDLGLAYQRDNLFGLNFVIEYNYNEIQKDNTLKFVSTSADSPGPSGSLGADVTLINHNIDIDYTGRINDFITYGAGPSFVITNRIIETGDIITETGKTDGLYDKLASSGIGVNAFLSASLPLTADNCIFAFSEFKFRYTHSIWFDEGLRKLDDYNQDFVTGEISLGIGYSF
jgi:hypothetical protein